LLDNHSRKKAREARALPGKMTQPRKPVIAGNWKMYKNIGPAVETALELKPLVANATHCEVVIGPVYTALKTLADRLEGSNIKLAAQNVADEPNEMAYTGEVTANMLKDAGASYIIVAHSERRQFFHETDERANRKVRCVLDVDLTPIYCVGERLEEREAGQAEERVRTQLEGGLRNLTGSDVSRIIVAYEPVWAIGTGRTATPGIAQEMHAFIRHHLSNMVGKPTAETVRILYGGSVKPDNIAALMAQDDIDGALVGGASLDAKTFAQIVNYNRS